MNLRPFLAAPPAKANGSSSAISKTPHQPHPAGHLFAPNLGKPHLFVRVPQGTTTGWTHDNLGQVSGATSANHVSTDNRSYAYDGIGNRTSSTAAGATTAYWANTTGTTVGANNLNQYKKVGSSSALTYDDDGNMLYDGIKWTCTWDGENRLIQAEQTPVVLNGVKRVYNYDYLGRMYLHTTYVYQSSGSYNNGERFGLTYDGWNRIDSQVDWNWLHDEYVWGLDVGRSFKGVGGVGGMLMWKGTTDAYTSGSNNYTYYPAYDGNGNVIDLIGPSGVSAAHWEYDPFGNILRSTSTPAAGMDPATYFEFKFSTKARDLATGLYYYGYRHYNAGLGKWCSRDPIDENGGVNLYVAMNNTPTATVDILGLQLAGEIPAAEQISKNQARNMRAKVSSCCTSAKVSEGKDKLNKRFDDWKKTQLDENRRQNEPRPEDEPNNPNNKGNNSCYAVNSEAALALQGTKLSTMSDKDWKSMTPDQQKDALADRGLPPCWHCHLENGRRYDHGDMLNPVFRDHWVVVCEGWDSNGDVTGQGTYDYWKADAVTGADPSHFRKEYPSPGEPNEPIGEK